MDDLSIPQRKSPCFCHCSLLWLNKYNHAGKKKKKKLNQKQDLGANTMVIQIKILNHEFIS